MVLGTAVSQGLVFLALLAFARMYGPQAIGLQALFVSIAGIVVTVSSLRLDLALVLEDDERNARWVGAQAILQGLVVAIVIAGVVGIFGEGIRAAITADVDSTAWLALLPIATITGVALQVGLGHANRSGRFPAMVSADLLSSGVFALCGLTLWVWWPHVESLVVSRQLAQAAAVTLLILLGHVAWRRAYGPVTWRRVLATWRTHRQFLLYNTPYSTIGAFARDLPILIFAASGGVVAAASYALARSVTVAPVVLFSSAVSRAFYKEAVDRFNSPDLHRTVTAMTRIGLFVGLVPFAWLSVWGDVLFARLLGPSWTLSGQMAMVLAPAAWMSLQTGWPERMFEVARRQGVSFAVQVVFDLLNACILAATFLTTGNPLFTVAAFATSLFAFHVTYLVAIYRVAGYPLAPLIRDIASAVAGYLVLVVSLWSIREMAGANPWGLVGSCLAATILGAGLLRVVASKMRAR